MLVITVADDAKNHLNMPAFLYFLLLFMLKAVMPNEFRVAHVPVKL